MSNPPVRIFLSSTADDLEAYRQAVTETIHHFGQFAVRMELFGARPGDPLSVCQQFVAEADAVLVVVAHRYGWIPTTREGGDDRKSITWHEVEAASRARKPILAYVVDPAFPWTQAKEQDRLIDPDADPKEVLRAVQNLRDFKEHLADYVFETFRGPDDLAKKVARDLGNWLIERQERLLRKGDASLRGSFDIEAEIKTYRERAVSLYGYLPPVGSRTKLRVPIPLEELYVPLRAVVDLRGIGTAVFADAKDAERKLGATGQFLELPVKDTFAAAEERGRRGLVVLGDPGSGKTTYLKRLMLWLLRDRRDDVGLPEGVVPVFLPLRELANVEGGVEAFIESQLDHTRLRMQPGFGRRLMARGNLLFMFDGLDEVTEVRNRARVARSIEELVSAYPDFRAITSCRFAGYTPEVRLSEFFLETHLRPLASEDVESFVRNWYQVVETRLSTDLETAEERARCRAQELLGQLREPDFRVHRVLGLTRNPLLLANLCLVHYNGGRLPRQRASLYGACVDVLLEGWLEGQGADALVTAEGGRCVLQSVAFWLHAQEGRSRATAEELLPVITPALEAIGWNGGSAAEFLESIREKCGLFTAWDHVHYGFLHLGFQEYLAALEIHRRALEDRSVLRELAHHHGQSWWQEVAELMVGLEESVIFEPYLQEVIQLRAFSEDPDATNALLECAVGATERPFVDLIYEEPKADHELWARQLQALRILERMRSAALEEIARHLEHHPSPEIRQWIYGRKLAESLRITVTDRGGVELVKIPPGKFQMGSDSAEDGRDEAEGLQHLVILPAFLIGRYPVTNEEFARFLAGHPQASEPAYWSDRRYNQARQPVVGVTWKEARLFAEWLGCRLPTEAEWEYAARAGSSEPYIMGSDEVALNRVAWYAGNSGGRLHAVGEKAPNAWGLYDVLGNVWEWVEDDWHDDYRGAVADGSAWIEHPRSRLRVRRGGSFDREPRHLRVAYRLDIRAERRSHRRGFRIARSCAGD